MAAAHRAAGDDGALLQVSGLVVAFDGQPVLSGVDLSVAPGEVVAVIGTNGAGKSTLLDAVMGHVSPLRGSILLGGRDITYADARQLARMGVAHVPGGASSLPDLLVDEHLRLAAWVHRADAAAVEPRIQSALTRLPAVRQLLGRRAGELSGGEQHLLAVAMAVVQRPRLLLLDELSLGLSPSARDQVCELLGELATSGCAVVVVDQSIDLAARVADHAVFLERGRVRFEGDVAALADRSDLLRPVFLGGARDRSRTVAATTDGPVGGGLQVRGIVCRLGDHVVLRGADLAVPRAHVTAVSAPTAPARRRCSTSSPASFPPTPARFSSTASTSPAGTLPGEPRPVSPGPRRTVASPRR